jgi:hypothetical protein
MTTAQRIIEANTEARAIETEARELAMKTDGPNCFDRTWTFYDGSSITKTRDGYTTEAK